MKLLPFAKSSDLFRFLMMSVVGVALVVKLFIVYRVLYPNPQHVHDVMFGFSGYVHSLLESGAYRSCLGLPFEAIDPNTCVYTTRMPALPIMLVTLSAFVGTNMATVAAAKAVVASIGVAGALIIWTRRSTPSFATVLLFVFALLGPQVLKHAACLDYEEGLLVELMAIQAMMLAAILSSDNQDKRSIHSVFYLALVLCAGLSYLTKTTMLPFLVGIATFSVYKLRFRPLTALAVVFIAGLPVIGWGTFSWETTGRWTSSSSWNGENLLRGFNSESYQIYPDISVDRIFSAKEGILDNGQIVPMGHWISRPPFHNEWEWNDYYVKFAKQWILENPMDALHFSGKKAWAMFIDPKRVPRRVSAELEKEPYGGSAESLGVAWMIIARVLFFAAIVHLLIEARLTRRFDALWLLALIAAYSIPYVIVFASQRHAIPMLVFVIISLAASLARMSSFVAKKN